MRLDLYLKQSRIIKRRALAQAICSAGRVLVNGGEAKPSKTVKPGDRLSILFPSRRVEIEILSLPEKGRGLEAEESYRVTSEVRG